MRESRQTKEGKREGEKEKKKGEIEKKTVVAAEGQKVSVIQSVSCCDAALWFCKIVFLHIFYYSPIIVLIFILMILKTL